MYVPEAFAVDDRAQLLALMAGRGFGTLVLSGPHGLSADHIPFLIHQGETGAELHAHIAHANPAFEAIAAGAQSLFIVQGPDAYVTPSYHPAKPITGKVVPTWDYIAIHASGPIETITDQTWLLNHLHQLTQLHEQNRPQPWTLSDAPAGFIEQLTVHIVGIRMPLETLVGKIKAHQNHPAAARAAIAAALAAESGAGAREIAALMQAVLVKP